MPSIIIPAHNEGTVIGKCLRSILDDRSGTDLEIIVVCNGCKDDTAEQVRSIDSSITVIETEIASKANALNLGDKAATSFPRLYVDADIIFLPGTTRAIIEALQGDALAVSPVPRFETSGSSIAVRMYYAAWKSLPFHGESTIGGSGVYAMNEEGRGRFDLFPQIISDDGYVRLLFEPGERRRVEDACCVVTCPRTIDELVNMKSRVMAGKHELLQKFPELGTNEEVTSSMRAWSVVRRPHLWPCFMIYAWCKLAIRNRVSAKARSGQLGVWDRDESSRKGASGPSR